jgi:hypothetical protein
MEWGGLAMGDSWCWWRVAANCTDTVAEAIGEGENLEVVSDIGVLAAADAKRPMSLSCMNDNEWTELFKLRRYWNALKRREPPPMRSVQPWC